LSVLTIHSGHDEADLGCVSCAREMRVDLFRLRLVQRHESIEDVITSGSIIGSSYYSVREEWFGGEIVPSESGAKGDLVPS
jgi:hypothetical protein